MGFKDRLWNSERSGRTEYPFKYSMLRWMNGRDRAQTEETSCCRRCHLIWLLANTLAQFVFLKNSPQQNASLVSLVYESHSVL